MGSASRHGVLWLALLASPLLLAVGAPAIGASAAGAPAAGTAAAAVPAAMVAPGGGTGATAGPSLAQLLQQLPTASFADKQSIAHELPARHEPQVRAVLEAFLNENLYARSSDNRVFIGVPQGDDALVLTDALTGAPAGTASIDGFNGIDVDNQVRQVLQGALAQLDLASPQPSVRMAAVEQLGQSPDAATTALLRAHLGQEHDPAVAHAIRTGLALYDLGSADAAVRLSAVETLAGSLNPEAYYRLSALLQRSDDGSYVEPDARVRAAAQAVVHGIDRQRAFYSLAQTLLFGLSEGSVLVLAAIGLAITFGVMGVINMAHGELIMLGAYATYVVQLLMPQHIGASIFVAIPAAFLVSGLVGVAIERGVVRHLYGRPLETLLATFGISLLLRQAVRDVFTPDNRPVQTPDWMSGSLQINDALSITCNRMYIIVFTLIVFVALLLVLRRTRLGLEVRAVAQNRAMARAMGIRTDRIDAVTFGLGSGIAGIAGVALSQLTNVGPTLGQDYIVDSFMVVVFGGVGNLWGTQIGGNALGVVNKLLEPHSGAVLAKILSLVFLILFIQRRPRGLFPQKGRAAEN